MFHDNFNNLGSSTVTLVKYFVEYAPQNKTTIHQLRDQGQSGGRRFKIGHNVCTVHQHLFVVKPMSDYYTNTYICCEANVVYQHIFAKLR